MNSRGGAPPLASFVLEIRCAGWQGLKKFRGTSWAISLWVLREPPYACCEIASAVELVQLREHSLSFSHIYCLSALRLSWKQMRLSCTGEYTSGGVKPKGRKWQHCALRKNGNSLWTPVEEVKEMRSGVHIWPLAKLAVLTWEGGETQLTVFYKSLFFPPSSIWSSEILAADQANMGVWVNGGKHMEGAAWQSTKWKSWQMTYRRGRLPKNICTFLLLKTVLPWDKHSTEDTQFPWHLSMLWKS